MLMRNHPILSRFIIWIIFPIILILGIGYAFLLQSLPQKEGTVHMEGLNAPVKIIRDEHAIPHISAATDHDAFFALGYLHAQERLFQMTHKRRIAQGRVSEVFGIEALPMDKYMRAYGLVRAAKTALESLDEPALKVLETYAAGVNAWINEGNTLPVEFYILDTKPELWKPEDSILMIKLMALTLGPNHTLEINHDLLVKEVGIDKANEISPNVNAHNSSATDVYTASLVDDELQRNLISINDRLINEFKTGGEIAVGSNAWAVSGKYTKSGLPLIAGDPHLLVEIPSIWYLADIKGDQLHVTGATFPGLPLVFMGRNESVAWGVTNMMPDALDLYVERTHPLDQNQYEVDGQWVDMEIEEQLIHIKSEFPSFLTDPIPPVKWQIRRTRNGTLLSDAIGLVDFPLALRWTALDKEDKTFQSYLEMNYAEDLASFQAALREYKAPAVNFIYADAKNNIALFVAGKIPIRKKGNGRLAAPGWTSDYHWEKYIPFEDLPHKINPEEGYIINANNRNHPLDYPYIIGNYFSPPYRLNRIEEFIQGNIESNKKLEVQDFVALQGDTQSLQVKELLPFVLNLPTKTSEQKKAITQLKEWDGDMSGNSEASAIYEVWLRHFNSLLISDDLKGNALHEERGNQLQGMLTILRPEFIIQLVEKNQSLKYDWCDRINTPKNESCEELGLMALDATTDELSRIIGVSKDWEDIFETHFPHPVFSNSRFLDTIFARSIYGGSHRFNVNRADWTYSEENGYRTIGTAGYRQVIDFSDENLSGFINSTGQSGNILSEHYDDNITPFKQLKLWPMRLEAKQRSEEKLILFLEPVK